jgi:hypothetical protein
MGKIAILFAIISGMLLMAIQFRKPKRMMPLSTKTGKKEITKPIDSNDKKLAIWSGISFSLCLIFLILSLD